MENTEVKDTPLNLFKGIKEAFHYWKWFLISVVVCVTLSVLYVWVTQPVYQVFHATRIFFRKFFRCRWSVC